MAYVVVACQSALGLVFLIAVLGKLRTRTAYTAFLESVRDMGVAPRWTLPMGGLVVAGEASAPVLLVVPATRLLGFVLCATLLVAFMAGTVLVIRRGTVAFCVCFGQSRQALGRRHLARNAALVTLAVAGAVGVFLHPTDVTRAGVAMALIAGVLVAAVMARLDDVIDLFATGVR